MKKKVFYKEVDHTADMSIEVCGNSLLEIFNHAADGMYALAGVQINKDKVIVREIKIDAADKEALLVDFLSELLFRLQKNEVFINNQINIHELKLSGYLNGYGLETMQREIKAVTYHQMNIIEQDGKFHTRIVFDI